MSDRMWIVLMALCIGVVTGLDVLAYARKGVRRDWVRDTPRNGGWNLPMIIVFLLSLSLFTGLAGDWSASFRVFGWLSVIFLQISLYFLLLALTLPLLRRYFRAETCAILWIVPNYLYMGVFHQALLAHPRWIIPLPIKFIQGVALIWLVGVVGVLGWKIFSHLRFRRWLLRGAEEVSDPEVLAVWQAEVDRAREKKPKFRLVTSPQASTPITIGLFSKSVRVVLPQRHYTPEELKLIFRHELVHIGREDAWNKFFVAFCIAMCWFNPLMWLAMGRSSEDLELSCDETVLSSLGEGERRQYADLILRTAGDGRGFTTCLSASASALRYRLKSIVKPGKKISGALLVGVAFILLFVSFGQISLAYEAGTGESAIYRGMVQEVSLRQVRRDENGRFREELECRDEGALTDYLTSLPLSEIVDGGDDFYGQTGEQIVLLYDAPEDILSVILWDDYIKVVPFWENRAHYYHVSGGLDWGKLDQLLEETA